jgi:hypothetical protein
LGRVEGDGEVGDTMEDCWGKKGVDAPNRGEVCGGGGFSL